MTPGTKWSAPCAWPAFVAPKEPAPPVEERRPLRRRDESPRSRYEEDDEDDRPRRSRRRKSSAVTPDDVEDARAIVSTPARGLIFTGWLGLVFHVVAGIAAAAIGAAMIDQPNLNKQDEENAITLMVLGGFAVLGSVPYCVPIAIGGHKLLRIEKLKKPTWPYVSGILSVCSVMFCGICSPFTWFAAGFGIWAIVALNNTDVQRVIEGNARNDQGYRDDVEL